MLTRHSFSRPTAGSRPAFRPCLETLEDRVVPESSLFQLTPLVSNQAGVARLQDPQLVNAWGMALSPGGGALWVSAEGTGVSTLYVGDVNGSPLTKSGLTVTIPGGAPTGQVFNPTADFVVSSGNASSRAIFIFAGLSGFVTGWSPVVPAPGSRVAQVAVFHPGQAIYTGLALGNNGAGNLLYAADFQNGDIEVFGPTFQSVTLAGNFTDPDLPKDFKPFNIQNLGGQLFVTYARDKDGDASPDGHSGFVSVFDTNGNFVERLVSRGHLDQPWGLALAPADFGEFSGALLVGNHGNGRIHAFDPNTGDLLGVLRDELHRPIRIDGLWGLTFGNGVSFGDKNALYFAAGPEDGTNGLLGSLRVFSDDQVEALAGTLNDVITVREDNLADQPGDVGGILSKHQDRIIGVLPEAAHSPLPGGTTFVAASSQSAAVSQDPLPALDDTPSASVLDDVFAQDPFNLGVDF
ncbi:MAG: TIGR03118 family protein [Gemmataceae bacterium]|nr:TIGR03118 family protein [Gemmataceae bacterium]MCI0740509.1 TIGR03118 family protein [Gemmataceae bacterium]